MKQSYLVLAENLDSINCFCVRENKSVTKLFGIVVQVWNCWWRDGGGGKIPNFPLRRTKRNQLKFASNNKQILFQQLWPTDEPTRKKRFTLANNGNVLKRIKEKGGGVKGQKDSI